MNVKSITQKCNKDNVNLRKVTLHDNTGLPKHFNVRDAIKTYLPVIEEKYGEVSAVEIISMDDKEYIRGYFAEYYDTYDGVIISMEHGWLCYSLYWAPENNKNEIIRWFHDPMILGGV